MSRSDDDLSWTFIKAGEWRCNICGAESVSTRWKKNHQITDGCLSVLLPEYTKIVLQSRNSQVSNMDVADFQNFDQLNEDGYYSNGYYIELEGKRSWTSDSFDVNNHRWAFQAAYGRNCIQLSLVWLQKDDQDYRTSLGMRFKFGDREFGEWECFEVHTDRARTRTWTINVDTAEFQVQMKVFSSDPLPKEEQPQLSKHDLEFLAKYDNFSTRNFFEWISLHSIPREAVDDLIKVFHNPGFDTKQTPDSRYLMEKIEKQFYSTFTKKTLEFEKDGRVYKLNYNDPESILDHVLASDKYMEGWVSRSEHDIDHPSGWDGWIEYEKEHQQLLNQNHQLVLGTVWMDKYVAEESRQHSVCSVIISFANFSKKVLHTQSSRFLVCTIPGHLMEFQSEILRKTVIAFFSKLENATLGVKKFPFTAEPVPVCGGLFAVKGDHMEKTHIAGIVGPAGNVPSFYTKTKKQDITNLNKKKIFRDPLYTRVVLSKIRSKTTKSDKADITRVTGITERESPFWDLKIFARHFYMRFGICSLHLLHLGVTKKYTEEIGVVMKKQYMTETNKRTKASPTPQPDMTRITMPIYNKKYNGTVALTGRMWSTWTAISTAINSGLLDDTALQRWSFVMEGLRKIDETTWTREQVKDDGELDQLVRDIVRTILNSFQGLGDATPDWNIPNIETLFALARSIRFLGPLWFQSTDMEESTNKLHRGCIRATNHKMIANQMLKEVDRRRAIEMVKFKDDEEKKNYLRYKSAGAAVNPKKEREFFAGLHPTDKDMTQGDINTIQKQLDLLRTENVSYKVKGHTRTYFESVFFHKRKIEIVNKPMLIYQALDDSRQYGELQSVFNVLVTVRTDGNEEDTSMKFFCVRKVKKANSTLSTDLFEYGVGAWENVPVLDEDVIESFLTKYKHYSDAKRFFLV